MAAPLDVIERKRDGKPLTSGDWSILIAGLQDRTFPSYQLAAFNVAVAVQGLSADERGALYGQLAASGMAPDRLELSDIGIDRPLYGGTLHPHHRTGHSVVRRKISSEALSSSEIEGFIQGVTDRTVTDDEIAAFCMAVYLRGMSREETVALTRAMLYSGEVLEWPDLPGPAVDKHSTGGVGDKISLPPVSYTHLTLPTNREV